MTNFISSHPGGSGKIIMAAGRPLEPFWEMFPFHQKQEIITILDPFKIGNLHPNDLYQAPPLSAGGSEEEEEIDLGGNLIIQKSNPLCAETKKESLTNKFITPAEDIYIRNHNKVPDFDEDFESDFQFQMGFRIHSNDPELEKISQKVSQISLSLEDLKSLPAHKVTTVL